MGGRKEMERNAFLVYADDVDLIGLMFCACEKYINRNIM